MIVLDLWSEVVPVWQNTNSFNGKNWIWSILRFIHLCNILDLLHNFGGKNMQYGAFEAITSGPVEALANTSYVVGMGLTPEGILQNPVVYDLWSDVVQFTTTTFH